MFFRSVFAALNVLYCIVLYCSYCIVLLVLYINVMYMWRNPRLVLNVLFGQSTKYVYIYNSGRCGGIKFEKCIIGR